MDTPRRSLRDPNRPPIHPGAILTEIILGSGELTRTELATALGISRQMLHGILSEKHPVTVEMAVRLGHVLGNGAEVWINLQRTYDLWHARRAIDVNALKVLNARADAA